MLSPQPHPWGHTKTYPLLLLRASLSWSQEASALLQGACPVGLEAGLGLPLLTEAARQKPGQDETSPFNIGWPGMA